MRAIDLLVSPAEPTCGFSRRAGPGRPARMLRGKPHGDNIAAVRPRHPAGWLPPVPRPGGAGSRAAAPMEERPVSDGTTLSALVRAAARQRPEAPAVVAGDRRLSWGELDAALDRAAAGYAERGLAPGERVAVQ